MVLSHNAAIMTPMDHTPLEDLLTGLEAADPADAPETADAIAAALSEQLDDDDGDPPETPS